MLQSMGSQRVGHAQVTEQRTESGLWVPNPEVSPYCRGQVEAMPEWSTGWRRPRGQKNPSERPAVLAGPGRSPRKGRPGGGVGADSERHAWAEAHEGMEDQVLKWATVNQERREAMRCGPDPAGDCDGRVLSEAHERDRSMGTGAQECEALRRLLMSGGSGRMKGKRGAHMKEKTGDFTRGGGAGWEEGKILRKDEIQSRHLRLGDWQEDGARDEAEDVRKGSGLRKTSRTSSWK